MILPFLFSNFRCSGHVEPGWYVSFFFQYRVGLFLSVIMTLARKMMSVIRGVFFVFFFKVFAAGSLTFIVTLTYNLRLICSPNFKTGFNPTCSPENDLYHHQQ